MSMPPPAQLTGKQLQQLCDALLDAFPTRDDLRMMVRIELDTNLDAVAGGENLRVVVFNLVSWAEQTGCLPALVAGACAQNPGNPRLQAFQAGVQDWWAPALPAALGAASPPMQVHRAPGPTAIDLFLTYSRQDATSMHTVQETLRGAGLTVWTDEGLEPGTPNWEDVIAEAIHQAQGMVVLLSPHARMSEWVKRELTYARAHGKQIFPLLLDGDERTAVPLGLSGVQWVDGRGRVSAAARELAPVLLHHLGRAVAPAITFDWVTIPAGAFLMGSDKQQDQDAYDEELPQHTIHLPAFRIARVPVTVAQFATYVQATGYCTAAERRGSAFVWTGADFKAVKGANWQHPRGPESDVRQKQDHPVSCVSWQDAAAFCQWASQATGVTIRLPTEAEWEKAARGPDGRCYPWGNQTPDAKRCNFNMNAGDTTPVDSYPGGASPYGVLDMAGNVWEWTSSLFQAYPYRFDDGREDLGADGRRTLRGGSFHYGVRDIRCACRYDDIYGVSIVGLRVMSPDC